MNLSLIARKFESGPCKTAAQNSLNKSTVPRIARPNTKAICPKLMPPIRINSEQCPVQEDPVCMLLYVC